MKLLKWIFIVILLYISVLGINILYPPKPVNLGESILMPLPRYSKVLRYRFDKIIAKVDSITGENAQEFEDSSGQPLYSEGWQRYILQDIYSRSLDTKFLTKRKAVFIPSWIGRQEVDLSADHFIESFDDVFHEGFDEKDISLYPNYRPDTYGENGQHLCNVYGITIRSEFTLIIKGKSTHFFAVTSNSEIWTPYRFKLGKFDPLNANIDFKKMFY